MTFTDEQRKYYLDECHIENGSTFVKILDKDKIIKTQKMSTFLQKKIIENEINVQIECNKLDIGPKLYSVEWYDDYCIMIMERYTYTFDQLINSNGRDNVLIMKCIKEAVKIIEKMHDNDYFHGDLHTYNIMFTRDDEMKFIDFGLSKKLSEMPEAIRDYLKFADYHTIYYMIKTRVDKNILKYLDSILSKFKNKEKYLCKHDEYYDLAIIEHTKTFN